MRKLLNKRKKRIRLLIVVGLFVLLFIGVGYSYLRETLTINSNTEISSMRWDVHFDNVRPKTGSIAPISSPTIGSDGLSVTTSLEFTQPGQFYEYTVDVKNQGSIDAMIESFEDTALTEDQQKYLMYSATYSDGTAIANKQILTAGSTEKIKVRIEVKEDLQKSDLPASGDQIKIKFKLNYIQADDTAIDKNASAIHYVNRQVEGQITPGDIIRIGETEKFYVISSDATKTVLVAKYNLLVGNESHDQGSTVTPMNPSTTQGYGLQSIDAISSNWNTDEWKGMVAFSSTNYWDGGNGTLLSPYNANGASYDGNPYPKVYDTNSNIYQYISGNGGYVDKLKEMGAPSTITGRLLSYEEADSAQAIEDNGTSIILDGRQSYWLGSARNIYYVWGVGSSTSGFSSNDYSIDSTYGVRPVIEISTSEIN